MPDEPDVEVEAQAGSQRELQVIEVERECVARSCLVDQATESLSVETVFLRERRIVRHISKL